MAHYALINKNNIVIDVIVAEQDFINTLSGKWVQTSYNTKGGIHYNSNSGMPSDEQSKAMRKNYAGIGYLYDEMLDAFIPPKPYPSWVLNLDSCLYEAPIQYPSDNKVYTWNEEKMMWEIEGEINV